MPKPMTSPHPATAEAVAPDVLAKQVADAASDMCEIARIVGEWRHGPKQSLTAVREIRACLAAKPPASGVDAVVEAMENDPFWQDAPLAGTTQQDQRIRHYAEVAVASLSPAATSGSEAGGLKLDISKEWLERKAKEEGDHETGVGSITGTINLTPERIAELEQVALKSLPVWAQNEISRLRALSPPTSAAEPVARVPIHPRMGPLWMDTFSAADAADAVAERRFRPLRKTGEISRS